MTYTEVVDKYMNGYCMFLAAALHHRYGFKIGLLALDFGSGERLSHAWVVIPEGKCLDIQGEQTLRQITQPYGGLKVYEEVALWKLEELSWARLKAEDDDVACALIVAQRHLAQELSKYD